MGKCKYPKISTHPTLKGHLKVNWEQKYQGEFNCPYCQTARLSNFRQVQTGTCKFRLDCNSCGKVISLTCKVPSVGYKHLPISTHQTLSGTIKVNWKLEYSGEFSCPHCNREQLKRFYAKKGGLCNFRLRCNSCRTDISLSCPVPVQIYRYQADRVCPNPLCVKTGPNNQKGWIYLRKPKSKDCACYFCDIVFNPVSKKVYSWIGSQEKDKLLPFCFDDDIWDLRHFYNDPNKRKINFQTIDLEWYKLQIKQYLYYLLKSKIYGKPGSVYSIFFTLRQFGKILKQNKVKKAIDINREVILTFLNLCQNNKSITLSGKLSRLKIFFEWLDLEVLHLIRSRDFPKHHQNDADWLDEVTRTTIKEHLPKIPAPIARHYLVQEYTAARPSDLSQIAFNSLVEDNGKWYIRFYQQKVERWHQIPASRKIRQVIEEQQKWIRKTFGDNYSYLFCHFRAIKIKSYPTFPNIKPLPIPPKLHADENPMVRIIRILIEKENILDANGQKPHFTGKITRSSRLQEVRLKYGLEAAQLYGDHKSSKTTFQHYASPTREQVAEVDLPFQELLMNPDNKFLPWQSLPESLLKNPSAHELDLEIAPRLVVYGHCTLDPKTPCPINLFPKCYGCSSFRPSTSKLSLYERQYQGEEKRLIEAEQANDELIFEEAKDTIEAMDRWLPELRSLADGKSGKTS